MGMDVSHGLMGGMIGIQVPDQVHHRLDRIKEKNGPQTSFQYHVNIQLGA
jgi:hypothetical protein